MLPAEIGILQQLENIRTPFLDALMETVTFFGEDTLLIIIIAILYFMVQKESAYRLCFLCVFSLGLNGIIKNLFRIPRPFSTGKITCVRPETATGYSFPSGHTQSFSTWSVSLARLFRKKRLLISALFFSVAVGFSRMYLGAHYPSDVLTGLLLGIFVGFFGSALYEKSKNPKKLYLPVLLGMMMFGGFFLLNPDPHFADYFKCVGLMGGLTVSSALDSRFGTKTEQVTFKQKLLRMILAILLALLLKAGMKLIPVPQNLSLSLIWDTTRYLVLGALVFGVYPLWISKLK